MPPIAAPSYIAILASDGNSLKFRPLQPIAYHLKRAFSADRFFKNPATCGLLKFIAANCQVNNLTKINSSKNPPISYYCSHSYDAVLARGGNSSKILQCSPVQPPLTWQLLSELTSQYPPLAARCSPMQPTVTSRFWPGNSSDVLTLQPITANFCIAFLPRVIHQKSSHFILLRPSPTSQFFSELTSKNAPLAPRCSPLQPHLTSQFWLLVLILQNSYHCHPLQTKLK